MKLNTFAVANFEYNGVLVKKRTPLVLDEADYERLRAAKVVALGKALAGQEKVALVTAVEAPEVSVDVPEAEEPSMDAGDAPVAALGDGGEEESAVSSGDAGVNPETETKGKSGRRSRIKDFLKN